jgi:hypothetical protein
MENSKSGCMRKPTAKIAMTSGRYGVRRASPANSSPAGMETTYPANLSRAGLSVRSMEVEPRTVGREAPGEAWQGESWPIRQMPLRRGSRSPTRSACPPLSFRTFHGRDGMPPWFHAGRSASPDLSCHSSPATSVRMPSPGLTSDSQQGARSISPRMPIATLGSSTRPSGQRTKA